MIINEKLFDEIISNALDVLRLTASQKAEAFARLKAMEDELVAKLSEVEITKLGKRQMKKLIDAAAQIIQDNYVLIAEGVNLPTIGEAVARSTVKAFVIALGVEEIKLPPKTYFDTLKTDLLIQGAPTKDWWQAQAEDTKLKFAAQVRQGAMNGETNQQIVARIVGKNGQPGVMDVARSHAQTLVHSSVQTVANEARRKTFQANDDIVKGIKQVSTLDSHTSLICVSYSGAEWNLDYEPINGTTLPYKGGVPRHWGCRSVEVPITKTFAELGLDIPEPPTSTRASESGQIAANTSFNDFLKRRGKAYQDEVLGVGRAELWRKGKITLRDLVNGDGNPLTLSELLRKVKQ